MVSRPHLQRRVLPDRAVRFPGGPRRRRRILPRSRQLQRGTWCRKPIPSLGPSIPLSGSGWCTTGAQQPQLGVQLPQQLQPLVAVAVTCPISTV